MKALSDIRGRWKEIAETCLDAAEKKNLMQKCKSSYLIHDLI